jgi:hypothetical protein
MATAERERLQRVRDE